MAALTAVETGVWRWDGVDADHGFPIVGYVVSAPEGVLLIDPPGTSGSREEIEQAGAPRAILITSRWHVRGAGKWKSEFNVPIAAPASAAGELREAGTQAETYLAEGDTYMEWQVLHLQAQGEAYTELAFWHPGRRIAVIGDLVTAGRDGSFAFGPHVFSHVPLEALQPIARRIADLKPRLVLSSHIGARTDGEAILAGLAGR